MIDPIMYDADYDPEPDWTEYDERVLQQAWEMDREEEEKPYRFIANRPKLESDYDRPAGPPSPFGENGIGQSGTDVSTW